jgi:uncharacterized Zn-binding protein involved in type VI secretion
LLLLILHRKQEFKMAHQKARVGDRMNGTWIGRRRVYHVTGVVISGSPNVFVNGKRAARLGDRGRHSHGGFTIITGRPDVLINGKRTAFKGSRTNNHSGKGTLVTGSPNVYVS